MINKERLLNRFLEYVQIDSPTKNEKQFAEHLMKEMEAIGFDVMMDDAGEKVGSNSGNLIGKLTGLTQGETILLSAHMDTVSPGVGVKPHIKDGIIYSDGTTVLGGDDKAGIAAIMEALETIKERKLPHGNIEVVFTIHEEGGLYGAKNLAYDKINSKIGFVFDSSRMPGEIIVQAPAKNNIKATFIGKGAHAGVAPEEGISAIQIASEAVSNMKLLRIDEETTANIGFISGGQATNIVASEAIIEAEVRSLKEDKLIKQTDHMIRCCEEAAERFGGKVKLEVEEGYGAIDIDVNHEIVKKVEKACKNIGLEPQAAFSGGGSDANVFNQNGITAVNLGIGQRAPHSLNEHLYIKDLEASAKLALEIIKVYS